MSKQNKINKIDLKKDKFQLKLSRTKLLTALLIPTTSNMIVTIVWPLLSKESSDHERNIGKGISHHKNIYPTPNSESLEITFIQGFYHLLEVAFIACAVLIIFYWLFQYLKNRCH